MFRVRVIVCNARYSVLRGAERRERFEGLGRGDKERKCCDQVYGKQVRKVIVFRVRDVLGFRVVIFRVRVMLG